jgi:small subunit ribosomal protein S6
MVIISPDVPEEELQGMIDQVTGFVETAGGTVTLINRETPWGRRRLAYPIRHSSRDVRDGFYALFYVEVDAAKMIEIERDIKLTDQIMRYLVTQQVAPAMIPASELEAAAAAEAAADAQEDEIEAAMAEAAAAGRPIGASVPAAAEPAEAEAAPAVEAEPEAEPVAEAQTESESSDEVDGAETAEES